MGKGPIPDIICLMILILYIIARICDLLLEHCRRSARITGDTQSPIPLEQSNAGQSIADRSSSSVNGTGVTDHSRDQSESIPHSQWQKGGTIVCKDSDNPYSEDLVEGKKYFYLGQWDRNNGDKIEFFDPTSPIAKEGSVRKFNYIFNPNSLNMPKITVGRKVYLYVDIKTAEGTKINARSLGTVIETDKYGSDVKFETGPPNETVRVNNNHIQVWPTQNEIDLQAPSRSNNNETSQHTEIMRKK